MKKQKRHHAKKIDSKVEVEKTSRREAITKVGKYAAFTAASMLIVLSPKESQASSVIPPNPGW